MKPGPAHRLVYNGDCNHLFVDAYAPAHGPMTMAVFDKYLARLAASGVDTLAMNVNASRAWYPSRAIPHMLDGYHRGDREYFRSHFPPPNDTDFPPAKLDAMLAQFARMNDRFLDLAEAGVNWAAALPALCRRHGLAPWVSLRMNDMHGHPRPLSFMNSPLRRRPELLLSGRQADPTAPVQTVNMGLNYACPEVRDEALRLVREVVNDFAYEGLELDWMRCPLACEPPATAADCALVTAWLAEVRALTAARARARGRPYPVGVRGPGRPGLWRELGLDVSAWAAAGLLDFVCPTNFWQTTWEVPHEEWRAAVGDRVAVYGVIEAAPNWLDAFDPASGRRGYRLLPASPEFLRGNAANKLAAGADAIELFNFFCANEPGRNPGRPLTQARYDAIRGLGDLAGLRGQPKHYALATQHGAFMFPAHETAEQVPATLLPGERRAFRVTLAAEPAAARLGLTVQVVFARPPAGAPLPRLGVSVNGSWPSYAATPTDRLLFPTGVYTHHLPEHAAADFAFPAAALRDGWNECVVYYGAPTDHPAAAGAPPLRVLSLELAVRPPTSSNGEN